MFRVFRTSDGERLIFFEAYKNNKTPDYHRDIFCPPTLLKMHIGEKYFNIYVLYNICYFFPNFEKFRFFQKTQIFGAKQSF